MRQLTVHQLHPLPFDAAESINQLRVNLGFCGTDIKSIMLTSSTPDEGKSFVSMNLWHQMAGVGARTILVDCDLRNSEMRTRYGIGGQGKLYGIAHYLAGQVELEDVIYETNVAGGYLVPVTTNIANPSILLEGERFAALMKYCRGQFDYVLVDTPPLMNVADGMNIASHCDGSVLVVRSGVTPRRLVENSIHMLQKTSTPLLGTVLNRVDTSRRASQYYYKRNYTKYGYDGGSNP